MEAATPLSIVDCHLLYNNPTDLILHLSIVSFSTRVKYFNLYPIVISDSGISEEFFGELLDSRPRFKSGPGCRALVRHWDLKRGPVSLMMSPKRITTYL